MITFKFKNQSFSLTSINITKLEEYLKAHSKGKNSPVYMALSIDKLYTESDQIKLKKKIIYNIDQEDETAQSLNLNRLYLLGESILKDIVGINKFNGNVVIFSEEGKSYYINRIENNLKDYAENNFKELKSSAFTAKELEDAKSFINNLISNC